MAIDIFLNPVVHFDIFSYREMKFPGSFSQLAMAAAAIKIGPLLFPPFSPL